MRKNTNSFALVLGTIIFFVLSLTSEFFMGNHYPFLSSEALIFSLGIILALLLLYIPFHWLKIDFIFIAGLLVLFISLVVDWVEWFPTMMGSAKWKSVPGYTLPLIYGSASLFIAIYFRKKIAKVCFIGFLLIFLSTLAKHLWIQPTTAIKVLNEGVEKKTADLPNIYLLLLDEHLGLNGMAHSGQQGRDVKEKLSEAYLSKGFDLYAGAYSNYYRTRASVASFLNYSTDFESIVDIGEDKDSFKEVALFSFLEEQGYQINIYQISYFDYCKQKTWRCIEYGENTLAYLKQYPLPIQERILFFASFFIRTHHSQPLKRMYKSLRKYKLWTTWGITGPLAVPQVIKKVEDDILERQEGNVFFMHLLAPHRPYLYDETCSLNPIFDWGGSNYFHKTYELDSRRVQYQFYYGQVSCLHKQLEEFLESLKLLNAYDDATIFLVGDHGSRIIKREQATAAMSTEDSDPASEKWIKTEMIDTYSAFLAIKSPGKKQEARIVKEKISIAKAMNDYFQFKEVDPIIDEQLKRVYYDEDAEISAREMQDF